MQYYLGKKYSPQNDAKWLSDSHDFIIVYSKSKNIWRPELLPRSDDMDKRYKNPDNDSRGNWKPADFSAKTYSSTTDYPISTPSGRIVNPPQSRSWIMTQERLIEMIEDNRIWFGAKGRNVPSIKKFISEVKQGSVSKTIWLRDEVGDNQSSKKEIKGIFTSDTFDTPKPTTLLNRVFQAIYTNPLKKKK